MKDETKEWNGLQKYYIVSLRTYFHDNGREQG